MRDNLKPIARNVLLVCLIRALFTSGSMSLPAIVPYLDSINVPSTDLLTLELVFSATMLPFLFLNGQLADRIGKKRALMLGAAVMPLGQLVYLSSHSLLGLAMGEMCFALAFSLVLSADDALMYASLRQLRLSHRHSRIWGRVGGSETLAVIAGNLIGGLLLPFGPCYPLWGSLVGYLAMFLVTTLVSEPSIPRPAEKKFQGLGRVSKYCLWERPDIRWILFFPPIVMAASQAVFWLYPDHLTKCGIQPTYHGWVFALWSTAYGTAAWAAARLEMKLGRRNLSFLAVALVSTAFLLLGLQHSSMSFALVMLVSASRGFVPPVFSAALNKELPAEIGSRGTSLRGVCGLFGYMLALLLVRQLRAHTGTDTVFLAVSGVVLVAGSILASRVKSRRADKGVERGPPGGAG